MVPSHQLKLPQATDSPGSPAGRASLEARGDEPTQGALVFTTVGNKEMKPWRIAGSTPFIPLCSPPLLKLDHKIHGGGLGYSFLFVLLSKDIVKCNSSNPNDTIIKYYYKQKGRMLNWNLSQGP